MRDNRDPGSSPPLERRLLKYAEERRGAVLRRRLGFRLRCSLGTVDPWSPACRAGVGATRCRTVTHLFSFPGVCCFFVFLFFLTITGASMLA